MNKRRFVTSAIWPDKHKEILREMHGKGATALEIAIKLNRTRNSVIGFIHRSGLSNSRPKKQPPPKAERKPQEAKPASVSFLSSLSFLWIGAQFTQEKFLSYGRILTFVLYAN